MKRGGREKFFSLLFPLESNWIRIKLIVGRHVTFVRLSFRSRLIAGTGQGKLKNCWAARFHGLNVYIYIYIRPRYFHNGFSTIWYRAPCRPTPHSMSDWRGWSWADSGVGPPFLRDGLPSLVPLECLISMAPLEPPPYYPIFPFFFFFSLCSLRSIIRKMCRLCEIRSVKITFQFFQPWI